MKTSPNSQRTLIPVGTTVALHFIGVGARTVRAHPNSTFACDASQMTTASPQLSLLAAHGDSSGWPHDLSSWVAHWPVDVQWSQSDAEAIDFATQNNVHLLIVDDTLPPAGGIEAVRRIRRIGLTTPCLYVCNDPAPRLLSDAIKLDVFSVVDGDTRQREQLAAMIVRIALRLYQIQLPAITGLN